MQNGNLQKKLSSRATQCTRRIVNATVSLWHTSLIVHCEVGSLDAVDALFKSCRHSLFGRLLFHQPLNISICTVFQSPVRQCHMSGTSHLDRCWSAVCDPLCWRMFSRQQWYGRLIAPPVTWAAASNHVHTCSSTCMHQLVFEVNAAGGLTEAKAHLMCIWCALGDFALKCPACQI